MTIEEHILHLMQTASQEIDRKYRLGQEEHGGNLWEKFGNIELLKHLRDEIIDSFVYVQCAIDQLEAYRNDPIRLAAEPLSESDISRGIKLAQEKACIAGQS